MSTALTSYNNDRPPLSSGEVEYPADPASGAFFQPEFKKHDDLKQMMDSSKDSLKLEAMKRIIGMIAKGRDASDLFPAVVKNVVSKNIEVKKLVYVYLVRYAEEQQDLALLSISTFQRALKDPNQLIRASALRVLSSIRVTMIVPIVMLAIRDSVSDMSPYVRKTAAHAIPKLYSLDPDQKDELVSIIDKLLCDRTPLVVGSAAMAFSEVCPERTDLLHRSFRKLCSMLADVDEWGQIVLLGVLTRYCREHFCDPNAGGTLQSDDEKQRPFYEDSDASDSDSETDSNGKKKPAGETKAQIAAAPLDADHRLLLRTAKPLLQSRNSAVVMAVAQLFYHAGPAAELAQAGKSLVRLLRGPPEVQSVVLHSIASLTIAKKSMFEPYLKSFFVRNCDPTHIKLLKLEILTNLATETSVPVILRELQTYVSSNDKTFVAAAIQAIGRLAANIDEVTDTCLNGLLHLLSSKDEWAVGEAVVVVKRVLREGEGASGAVVARAARLLRAGRVASGAARAAAAWLVAERGARSPHAPPALARLLPGFAEEEDAVKLQILTLAVKLFLRRPDTLPLVAHALNLAKFDQSYDVRDRARLLRKFVIPENGEKSRLMANASYIFLAEKPTPIMESKFKDRQHLTLGTMSHYVGTTTPGYVSLPTFPTTAPPSSLRDPPTSLQSSDTTEISIGKVEKTKKSGRKESFFYESESSYGQFSSGDEDVQSSDDNADKGKRKKKEKSSPDHSSNSESGSGSDEESEESEEGSSSSESGSESDSSSGEESDSSKSNTKVQPVKSNIKKSKEDKKVPVQDGDAPEVENDSKNGKKRKTNLDLLLELDDVAGNLPIMTPSLGGFLTPVAGKTVQSDDTIATVSTSFVPIASQELLTKISGRGLSVSYRYMRSPHLYSPKMATVELSFTNQTQDEITNIRISQKGSSSDQAIHEFSPIPQLAAGAVLQKTIGIDFADTTQPIAFHIATDTMESQVSIKPPVGELMRSVIMSEARYLTEQKRLRGMTQAEGKGTLPGNANVISQRIFEAVNIAQNASQGNILRYSGQLLSSQCLVLVTIQINESDTSITVNCDKMAIGSMLLNEIKSILSR